MHTLMRWNWWKLSQNRQKIDTIGANMYVVIVSTCISAVENGRKIATFYFQGEYDGKPVSKVVADYSRGFDSPESKTPTAGKEYILHLEVKKHRDGVLYGRVERLRDLDDILEEF